ncbi:hypothetical protein [Vibrio phage CKB-S2]|nr:hypothetical protein [Vibrio phage CKB-S2]
MEFTAAQITGAAIDALMKSQDRDENWLAEKMDVKVPYVYQLRKGSRSMSLTQSQKVGALFGCKLSEFIAVGEKACEAQNEKGA